MPRLPRKYSEIKVYHIMIRGINKQNIFLDEEDRYKFLEIIESTKEKYNYTIYIYCIMNNHVHLVIYDKDEQLSKIMQSIEIAYAFYFNKKYDRVGHLFQNRFLAKKVEDKKYLLQLCRYIHQNPLKAGIGNTENYKWSSYQEYINNSKIIDNKMILSIFSKDLEIAKKEFIKFHNINSEINNENKINNFIEYEMCKKLTDDEIKRYIYELLDIQHIREIFQYNTKLRNEKLLKLKCLKKLSSISQLARVIGINRKMLERTLK